MEARNKYEGYPVIKKERKESNKGSKLESK